MTTARLLRANVQAVRTIQVYAANLVLAGLRLVSLAIAARLLGVTAVGAVGFGLAFAGLVAFLNNLGLDQAHVRIMADVHDRASARTTFILLRLASTALYLAIAVAAATIWVGPTEQAQTLLVVHLAVGFEATRTLATAVATSFQADERFGHQQFVFGLDTLARLALLAAAMAASRGMDAVAWFQPPSTGGGVFLARTYLAGGIAAVVVAGSVLWWRGGGLGRPSIALVRRYLAFGLPTIGFLAVTNLEANVDSVMIQAAWGSVEVGLYYAAQRLAFVAQLLPVVLYNVLYPRISHLASTGDPLRHRLTEQAARRTFALLAAAIPSSALLAPAVVTLLLGPAFGRSAPVVPILVLASLGSSYTMFHLVTALAHGHPARTSVAGVVGLATNLLLNLALIPDAVAGVPAAGLGAPGAALATAASTLAAGAYLSLHAPAQQRLPHVDRHLLASLVATAPTAALAWIVADRHPWLQATLAVPVLVASLGLLYATRVVQRGDAAWLVASLRRAVRD